LPILTCEDCDVVMFESGAIVLHIAEQHLGLLPEDKAARATALSWVFAALNTVELLMADVLRVKKCAFGDRPAILGLHPARDGSSCNSESPRCADGTL
jgi:glutathione S-transferase